MYKLATDLIPIIIFFVVYKYADINTAVISIMITMPCFIALSLILKKEVPKLYLWTTVLVVVLGGITIAIDNPLFFKVKPSLVYSGFAIALAVALLMKKNPGAKMFAETMPFVPEREWISMAWQWAVFSLLLAVINLYVAFMHTENTWVNFKTFVLPFATFFFIMFQFIFKYRKYHVPDTNK